MTKSMQPLLKWVGGKRRLLPKIAHLLPKLPITGRYFEPFVGGGSLLVHLQPSSAAIADACSDLMNLYWWVAKEPGVLAGWAKVLKHQHEAGTVDEGSSYYYGVREQFNANKGHSTGLHAAMFLYLMSKCYNGLCRYNSKGGFNAPLHKLSHMKSYIPSELSDFLAISEYLNEAVIPYHACTPEELACPCGNDVRSTVAKWSALLDGPARGDFIMVDPPYFPYYEQGFTSYSNGAAYTDEDQRWLRDWLVDCWKRGVRVMAWNSAMPKTYAYYEEWLVTEVTVKNCVGSKSYEGKKKDRVELCMINYDPATGDLLSFRGL